VTENLQIALAIEEAVRSGRQIVLATVVKVKGSAYRREGAKMVIDEQGGTCGMISGGCLEPDVVQMAEEVISKGVPLNKQYVLDEDVVWGLGLGCPGTVDLYLEPVALEDTKPAGPFGVWLACMKEKKAGILGTVLNEKAEEGRGRIFVSEEGMVTGSLGAFMLDEWFVGIAKRKLEEQAPKSETKLFTLPDGENIEIFTDVHVPPIELMIFGAGHDAIPLANISRTLGWQTTVIDPRPAYNDDQRFPGVNRILIHPSSFQEKVSIGRRTYVVVMNHHLERDQETLKFVLPSNAPYVGVLGPRSRRIRMLEALEKEGTIFAPLCMERVYSPVGLDIGAVSPEEIATSIAAEILSVRNGHSGGFLHGKEAIHQPGFHACRINK
jgi:xanthine/CO dehydrogenase XdhC/CoxF family maturation factor